MRQSSSKSRKAEIVIPHVSVSTAFGGVLKVSEIKPAFALVKETASVYEEDYDALASHMDDRVAKIIDRDQKLNFLLVAYGLALVHAKEDLFDVVVEKIGSDIGGYSTGYELARLRTDPE